MSMRSFLRGDASDYPTHYILQRKDGTWVELNPVVKKLDSA